MDFFDRQEKARHNTRLLVIYFIAGVVLLIAAIYIAAILVFTGVGARHNVYETSLHFAAWNPKLFLGVAVGTLSVIIIGSGFKTMELSQGGSVVATMLDGRLINPNTTDLDERKLVNVVEEMALASGVPVPQIYVMDHEPGINAFAAGHSTSDAVVAVTHGCMKLLTRDELQGVIGHEFSHILNGDMRLNLRLMGIIFGIICIAVIGRVLLYTGGGRSSRNRNALPLFGLFLIVLGGIGIFFGRLIQAAVSRQREFLADASSVQFTRNPAGLSGALKKIGGLSYGSKIENAHAGEASHMYFGNGVGESLFGLLATHPPLAERIRAIDPNFDGKFPQVSVAEEEDVVRELSKKSQRPTPAFPFPFPGMPQTRSALAGMAPPIIAAQAVMPNLGAPNMAHLHYAIEMRDAFPPAAQNAARDSLGATALVYALLTSAEPEMRRKQLGIISQTVSDAARAETERLLPEIAPLAAKAKLPLVDLALPSLRQLSASQYQQFKTAVQQLIESDQEIDLFEYVLQKITLRHLEPQFGGARKTVIQYYAMRPLIGDCAVLLSALAHVGSDDPAKAQAAFQQGAGPLGYSARAEISFIPDEQCDLSQVDAALNRISQAAPQIKKNVINACAQVVAADGVIQEMEAELLRAVADTLDCPMPPFLQAKAANSQVA
jgi:Zn-dependent protease with chaperone function